MRVQSNRVLCSRLERVRKEKHTSLLNGTADGNGAELGSREALQGTVEAGNGGTDSTDNDNLL